MGAQRRHVRRRGVAFVAVKSIRRVDPVKCEHFRIARDLGEDRRRRDAGVRRVAAHDLSLHGLAEAVGAEVLTEPEWKAADPSGNSFLNANTLEEFAALRERA